MNPRKPTALKRMQGTFRKDRANLNEIQPTIELSSEPPAELNEWGQGLYVQIMEEYTKIGLVSRLDTGSLLVLCNEFGTYCEADDIVKGKGLEVEEEIYNAKGELCGTKTIPNPMLKIRNDAFKNYKTLCTEFGLTPSSRATLSAPPPKDDDPISNLL